MSYQEALTALGETTERILLERYELHSLGLMTLEQFHDLGTVTVSLAHQQGRTLAEVSFMGWLETVGEAVEPVAAPPLPHYQDSERVRKALETITTAADVPQDRVRTQLERLAFAESVESSQQAFGEAMKKSRRVSGWTRGLEPNACQLCVWWARDGQVWPVKHSMPTHKGCTCVPIPTSKRIRADRLKIRAPKGEA